MPMLYLVDANVLITAKNLYYEFGRVDQYWEWLAYQSEEGRMKLPLDIYEEITNGKDDDPLKVWARAHKSELVLDEEPDVGLVQHVTETGYAPDLTDIELEEIGRDPFLIAHGLTDPKNRTVVTTEVRTNQIRKNRKIPSVCDDLGVFCCDQWTFGRELDFRTDWKRP